MKYDLARMQKKLSKYLDEERYAHTMGVMYMCAALAMVHGCDLTKAQVAGLLHDCAKCIPNKKKLKLCEDNHVPITDFEKDHPFLIHAKLGVFIAREKYDIEDPDILSAIEWHTTGRPQMSLLEKIVYIADFIEPMRFKARELPHIRRTAFRDLDETMYEILESTLSYLGDDPEEVDETSRKAYEYYKDLHEKRRNLE